MCLKSVAVSLKRCVNSAYNNEVPVPEGNDCVMAQEAFGDGKIIFGFKERCHLYLSSKQPNLGTKTKHDKRLIEE